ncbi:hypothetical protein KBD81_00405 [Candidatus Woesebacteria bacterium]|nr:hypothetical protein [Candidatus Woesebacteria bacterium]
MDQHHVLKFKDSSLYIAPQFGCNPIKLILNGQSILDGNETEELLKSDFLCKGDFLAPFPNRVCDGKYVFDGKEYQLEKNETARGHALHGFIMKKEFALISEESTDQYSRAIFSTDINSDEFTGYPFDISVTIVFILKENELSIEMIGENRGEVNAPFGVGWHPYLTVGKKIDECMLRIPAQSILETDSVKELIPTGQHKVNEFGSLRRQIGATFFDTCFVDLTDHTIQFENIELFMDETMNFIQSYTPDERTSIAIEPMSCAPDAFNSGLGLTVLKPGEMATHRFGLRLTHV